MLIKNSEYFTTALVLTIPLVVGGVIHMIVVKARLLSILAKPISLNAFGANKTYRGFVIMPLATVLGVFLAIKVDPAIFKSQNPWLLGVLLGLGYVIFELPNSYVKRRLGVKPGKLPENNRFWFALVDQTDSGFGCILVYALLVPAPALSLIICFLIGPLVHLGVNLSLYALNLRKEPL